jgi:hypothetical protein
MSAPGGGRCAAPDRVTPGARRRAGPRRRLLVALAAVAVAATVPACTPLYLPPVPSELPAVEPRLRLDDVRIDRLGGPPAVVFVPREVPAPGWAAVQWYPPTGGEVASASVWLGEDRVDHVVRVTFPGDVERAADGRWRAVLSFDGRVLRQLEWEEPAGP